MKHIHSLLSRLRIIDYLVVLCALCAIIVSLLVFTRKQVTIYVDLVSQTQGFAVDPFPPQYVEIENLHVGDSAYNGLGQKTAEITSIEKTDWMGERKTILITAKLHVVFDPRTRQYTYNDLPILVGNKFSLTTSTTSLDTKIVNIYASPSERFAHTPLKHAEVTVYIRKIEQWQATALTNFVMTDSNGAVLAQTKSITITPSEIDVPSDKGIIYKGESTILQDVRLTLDLSHVHCADDTCYFHETIPLKVGGKFWAQSNRTFIENGSIVNFTVTQ